MSSALTEQASTLLDVRDLRVETEAGFAVVEDVSFQLRAGETLGIVGESGSGKTTVGLALLGYARPGVRLAGGVVRFHGENLVGLAPERLRQVRGRGVSYVPQNAGRALNPSMRIGRQIREVVEVHLGAGSADPAVTAALKQASLTSDAAFQRRYIHQLSGGQQQRLALAIALACHSEILVLDELTTGLDVVTQSKILAEIGRLGRETGVGVVFVSHDLAAVASVATEVAVMYGGRIVEKGPVDEVLGAPVHPYTSGLVSSVPHHTGRSRVVGIPGTAVGVVDRPRGCAFAPRCALRIDACDVAMPPVEEASPEHKVRCIRWIETPAISALDRSSPAVPVDGSSQQSLLVVRGLGATYGRSHIAFAVRDISFAIELGECLALVGESGSGKSTIARCIAGLHAPASGEIVFAGGTLEATARDRSRDVRRRIQIVFQNPYDSLNPSQTVLEAIARPLKLFGKGGAKQTRFEVMSLLDRVRLPARLAGAYPSELSGGERQRVAIARALAAEPDLLICDEVTSALDVSVQAAVLDLLGTLQNDLGLAMLFITHDLGVVASIADRVLVLEGGRALEEGTVERVLQRPDVDYTRRLIAAVPELPARRLVK
jgi:peptide/nickel transport system ATP-binding protein